MLQNIFIDDGDGEATHSPQQVCRQCKPGRREQLMHKKVVLPSQKDPDRLQRIEPIKVSHSQQGEAQSTALNNKAMPPSRLKTKLAGK